MPRNKGFERNALFSIELLRPHTPSTEANFVGARTIDVLIFIPLIPAMCWFLPWERWAIPDKIVGPYLLFCAFAIWHFKQSWWAVLLNGLMGITSSGDAILDLRKGRMLKPGKERKASILEQAQAWPIADGFVLQTGQGPDADGARR